jgi:hypothetical protein
LKIPGGWNLRLPPKLCRAFEQNNISVNHAFRPLCAVPDTLSDAAASMICLGFIATMHARKPRQDRPYEPRACPQAIA